MAEILQEAREGEVKALEIVQEEVENGSLISNQEDLEIKKELEAEQQEARIDIFEILKIVSPGTALRIALEDVLRADMGALVVVMNDKVEGLIEGGFKVNCKFTPQKLVELCKMDGAVILSEDLKKILYANVLMIPSPQIPTGETGTRHKAAERTAIQASTLVIAVSERRRKISLYYNEMKYVLRNAEEILRRATGTLQILEKQREIYDDLLTNLNVLEVTGLVSLSDVCSILQRIEMINRIDDALKKSIVELGKEGNIIKMRLRELTRGIDKTEKMIMRDYSNRIERVKELITNISYDDLLDTEGMSKLLFNKDSNEAIRPKGFRILSRTKLSEGDIGSVINAHKDLNSIINLGEEELKRVLSDEEFAHSFIKELGILRENIMVGKKI
jgi:diadenylate cyclase